MHTLRMKNKNKEKMRKKQNIIFRMLKKAKKRIISKSQSTSHCQGLCILYTYQDRFLHKFTYSNIFNIALQKRCIVLFNTRDGVIVIVDV